MFWQILENISLFVFIYIQVGNVWANIGIYLFIWVDVCLIQMCFFVVANIGKYFLFESMYIQVGNVLANVGKYFFILVDLYSSWKCFGKYWKIFIYLG